MGCNEQLLKRIDGAAEDFNFPGWECGDVNAVVGAMRASGFDSAAGKALVFEVFEYSLQESFIQGVAFCFATFETTKWGGPTDGVRLDVSSADVGGPGLTFGEIKVESNGRAFSVPIEKEDLAKKGYLSDEAASPTAQAVLLKVCETIPKEWLFCPDEVLKKEFGMPDDARRIFVVDDWEHPSYMQLYGDEEMRPSDFPDIRSMVEAVCQGLERPNLTQTPNSSWQQQCEGVLIDE